MQHLRGVEGCTQATVALSNLVCPHDILDKDHRYFQMLLASCACIYGKLPAMGVYTKYLPGSAFDLYGFWEINKLT